MVTVEEGEGSCECTTVVLAVLVVDPTLAGEGMGEKLGRRRKRSPHPLTLLIH